MNLKDRLPASIAVSSHSPRWQSQIQRRTRNFEPNSNPNPKVHWLLDFAAGRKFVVSHECSALIVELPDSFTQHPEPVLKRITELCNNPQGCPLFLLGDGQIEPWRRILEEAGATEICSSILDFTKMWARIERLLKNRPSLDLTVEESVAARLPW